MRFWICTALLASLAACGQVDQRPATEGARACGPPGAFPDTGLCRDATPAQFRAVADMPLLAPQCVWRTAHHAIAPDEVMIFREQDCSAAQITLPELSFADGSLVVRPEGGAGAASDDYLPVLMIVPAVSPEISETLSREIANLPEPERSRCAIEPYETVYADEAYRIAPDPIYLKELQARDEPYEACGLYGVGSWEAYWELRDGKAIYFNLGQDQPQFDPKSVTFYRRGADGAWAKVSG